MKKVFKITKYILPAFSLPLVAKGQTFSITNPININSFEELIAAFLEAIVRLGAVVVVFMIIYSGFLFVKAQGNESELEKAKNTFLWTVIGAVILLGARAIAAMIQGTAAQFGI